MISMYFKILEKKSNQLAKNKTKYRRGVDTILKTNEQVIQMQEELTNLKPVI